MTGNVEQSTKRQETDDAGRAGLPAADQVAMQASSLSDAEVPTRVLIAPWGEVRSSAGSFILDDEAACATIAAFEAHGTDLPVDYEHQTLGGAYSSPSGEAPAAGWIKALSVISPAQAAQSDPPCEPGLWADVGWTSEALEKLRARIIPLSVASGARAAQRSSRCWNPLGRIDEQAGHCGNATRCESITSDRVGRGAIDVGLAARDTGVGGGHV